MNQYRADPRVNPRVEVRLRAVLFGALTGVDELELTTVNLSAGGALCESPRPVPLGRPVRLRLDLTDDSGAPHPVVIEALVLRTEGSGPYRVALHFVNVPPRILDLVRKFVFRSPQGASP
jgi:c-di-GMP-binding flagellar brake protein YcgR